MRLKRFRALVIEDENEIRKELISELNDSEEIDVVGEANSISSAYQLITKTPSDVVFLDIQILEGSSIDLILKLKKNQIPFPPIVITTGYKDFEDAKRIHNELNDEVITIMNKPFWKQWPDHKIKIIAALERMRLRSKSLQTESAILIPDGRQMTYILPSRIVVVKTGEKRLGKSIVLLSEISIECQLTLSQLMEKLPDYFLQVSRFECINTKQISVYKQFDRELFMKSGYKTNVGKTYHSDLVKFLNGH